MLTKLRGISISMHLHSHNTRSEAADDMRCSVNPNAVDSEAADEVLVYTGARSFAALSSWHNFIAAKHDL